MNIYKKQNQLHVSEDGCPEGWQTLGSDTSITHHNKKYVLGYANGATIWDTARMAEDAKPKVPYSISPMQMRMSLTHFELRTTVEAAVANASQDIKDMWNHATEFRRDNVYLLQMATALGFTADQMDQVFIYGDGL